MRLRLAFVLAGAGMTSLGAIGPPPSPRPAPMPREAQNALVDRYCSDCHSAKAKRGDLVLEGFDAASPFLGADVLEKMILKLRTSMMPPPSAERPEAATLSSFIETLEARADASAARSPDPGWRPFQRLNRAEYALAVRDLLGVEVDASAFLPADTLSAGFDNVADVQTVSPALITAYLRGAAHISRLAVGSPSNRTPSRRRIFSCYPTGQAEEMSCAATIIKRLTEAAYRGTGAMEETSAALSFYAKGRERGSFDDGIRLALQSILANPRFLFRTESPAVNTSGEGQRVSDAALASRLSFFLWSSAPDGPLIAAANRGDLRTPEGLSAQVRRMIADPRAEALATRFAAQWLRLQDLGRNRLDPALFPGFDKALAASMRRETEMFVLNLFRSDRSVVDLITSDQSFLDDRLAAHYGIPGVRGGEFRATNLPDARRGLLGQGSVLVLTSLGNRTSPVLRGKWVLDVLLGTPPPPPPPNVPGLDDTVKPTRNGEPLSTRQRVEEHRRNPACASCHRTIDPLGMALENFDAAGAVRRDDNGVAVDVVAELYDGRRIDGSAGLRDALLAHQDQILRNFAAQLLTYAIGRRLSPRDMPAVRAIVREAATRGNPFSAFVVGVVTSDAFLRPRAPKES